MALEEAPRLGFSDIVLLDALTYSGRKENIAGLLDDPRVRFVHGSIIDREVTDEALMGASAVVHLAAESHVDRSIESADIFFQTNVVGTQQLLESARRGGVEKFVHVSTDEVYGSIESGAWAEDFPLGPRSPYSASKAGSDLAALAYYETFELPVMVTRCSNNYGPRQFPEKIIPLFLTNLFDGKKVPLYGDGKNIRDWLHVDDHCRALLRVLEDGRAGEIYNVGGGTQLSNVELASKLCEACGYGDEMIAYVTDRLGHDQRYCVDYSKIERELGYHPTVDFTIGLEATVRWYRDHEAWWRPLKDAQ
jgi:dTDP-glucose 4,6-dehydratase